MDLSWLVDWTDFSYELDKFPKRLYMIYDAMHKEVSAEHCVSSCADIHKAERGRVSADF